MRYQRYFGESEPKPAFQSLVFDLNILFSVLFLIFYLKSIQVDQAHILMQQSKNQPEKELIFGYDFVDEVNQIRCRICYSHQKPLITLCECTGCKQYMHTQCATNWIGKKIELTQSLAIPKCEICFKYFNAELLMRERMISSLVLIKNLKRLKKIQFLKSFGYVLATIVAVLILGITFINQSTLLLNYFGANLKISDQKSLSFSALFFQVIFPSVFLNFAAKHFKKRKQFWQNSKVQVIELTLHPRRVLSE